MEQRREELLRRPLYVYDLPKDLLTTLIRKDDTDDETADVQTSTSNRETPKKDSVKLDSASGFKACSLCGLSFPTVEEQKGHVRSDFHNYNLKQKIRGRNSVTEAEFEKLVGDLDESLSGSDSSDSDDDETADARKETTLSLLLKKQAAISIPNGDDEEPVSKRQRGSGKAPLYWFTTPLLPSNLYLGMYRAIFTNAEQANESSILETLQKKQLTPEPQKKVAADPNNGVPLPFAYTGPHIFMCMIGGGHFAAMVVSLAPKQAKSTSSGPLTREATVLAHKTFHRYTTRRKQGGAQSANDAAKGAAHSAGSSLRRYNEQALTEEVRALLHDWKGMIDTSELLFVRATGNTNRRTLFGPYEGQILRQNDPRIRGFPFNTRRATQNELMRSFVELTRFKVLEVDEAALAAAKQAAQSKSSTTTKTPKQSTPAPPARTEAEETVLLHTTQLQALIRRSKLPALLAYLSNNSLSSDFRFYPSDTQQNHHAPTLLHLAAASNSPPLITGLLVKARANPTVLNGEGKTPFEVCGDRVSRDAFRVARGEIGEEAWDWEAARVQSALTRAEAEEREKREKDEQEKSEAERRRGEEERLKLEGPKVDSGGGGVMGRKAGKGRALALGSLALAKTPQERREEEARGLTPEMRARLERERRARAAEERMRTAAGGG